MAEEPVPIGVRESLSGMQALSIVFPGTCLAIFVIASLGAALANLTGHLAGAGIAGLVAVAFGALLARFLYDFVPSGPGYAAAS